MTNISAKYKQIIVVYVITIFFRVNRYFFYKIFNYKTTYKASSIFQEKNTYRVPRNAKKVLTEKNHSHSIKPLKVGANI